MKKKRPMTAGNETYDCRECKERTLSWQEKRPVIVYHLRVKGQLLFKAPAHVADLLVLCSVLAFMHVCVRARACEHMY